MWKIFSVLYFSLFVANFVQSHDIRDGTPIEEDTKITRHHHHHKTRLSLNETATKPGNDDVGLNANTTEEPKGAQETNAEKSFLNNSSVKLEEIDLKNIIEDSFTKSGNIPIAEAILISNLAKPDQLTTNENSSDDYSDSHNSEQEISTISNVDKPADDSDHNNDTGIVFITPNRKTLSQDVVIDIKARSGFIGSEEGKTDGDLNVPDISTDGSLPEHNNNMRSGYVPANVGDILKPSEYVFNDFHQPMPTHTDDKLSQYNNLNNPTPETLFNTIFNPRTKQAPLQFGSFNSREILYPIPNSREIWPQIHGLPSKSYFGNTFPGNQIYRGCPKCVQGRFPDPSLRRSADETGGLETDARTVELDNKDANAYPFVQDEAVNPTSSNDIATLSQREAYGLQDAERSAHVSNVPADSNSMTGLLTLPSYVPRSPSVMRRIGMGGIQRFVV